MVLRNNEQLQYVTAESHLPQSEASVCRLDSSADSSAFFAYILPPPPLPQPLSISASSPLYSLL